MNIETVIAITKKKKIYIGSNALERFFSCMNTLPLALSELQGG